MGGTEKGRRGKVERGFRAALQAGFFQRGNDAFGPVEDSEEVAMEELGESRLERRSGGIVLGRG